MQYSNLPPIIQEEEYADMPPLVPIEEEEYADMPPLVPIEEEYTSRNVYDLVDKFMETVQIGDTFKTCTEYHMTYQGKREGEDLYDFQIINQDNGITYATHYSKLGIYVTMGSCEKY